LSVRLKIIIVIFGEDKVGLDLEVMMTFI